MGVAVAALSGPLLDLGPDLIGLAVIFLAVALLTRHGWWMQRHARAIRGQVQRRIEDAYASRRLRLVGLIAFTGASREGAETVLFLWGLMAQVIVTSGAWRLAGGTAGLLAAALLGWVVFRGGSRISIGRFFAITTILIVLLAAGLFSTGVGRLQGLGLLPQAPVLWDTSALLNDQSVVGSLLAGLIGYRAAPSALEVGAYVGYVALVIFLFFPARLWRRPDFSRP